MAQVPAPTLGEFVARVEAEFNGHVGEEPVVGPAGKQSVRYLVRELEDGDRVFAVLPNIRDDQRLTPDVLHSLCSQLELRGGDFGLIIRL